MHAPAQTQVRAFTLFSPPGQAQRRSLPAPAVFLGSRVELPSAPFTRSMEHGGWCRNKLYIKFQARPNTCTCAVDSKAECPSIVHIYFSCRLAVTFESHCKYFCRCFCNRNLKSGDLDAPRLIQRSVKIKGMNQGCSSAVVADNFIIILFSTREHSDCCVRIISIGSGYLIQKCPQRQNVYICFPVSEICPVRSSAFLSIQYVKARSNRLPD